MLSNCQGGKLFKRSDVKDNPVSSEERVQKNIKEGKGIRFGKFGGTKGGVDFASSNEMWRATVEIFRFCSSNKCKLSGGIIITDWFNGGQMITTETLKLQ